MTSFSRCWYESYSPVMKKEILVLILLGKEFLHPCVCLSLYRLSNQLSRATVTFPIGTKHLSFYPHDVVAFGMKLPKVIYLLTFTSSNRLTQTHPAAKFPDSKEKACFRIKTTSDVSWVCLENVGLSLSDHSRYSAFRVCGQKIWRPQSDRRER